MARKNDALGGASGSQKKRERERRNRSVARPDRFPRDDGGGT